MIRVIKNECKKHINLHILNLLIKHDNSSFFQESIYN